jgi:hypothetical protein
MARETITILWMDGPTGLFSCDSTNLNPAGTVLNVYAAWELHGKVYDKEQPKPRDLHFPVSNIRHWSKD